MNCVVIGGSAGLGRSLSNRLAKKKHNLYLVSSDERDLAAVSADLSLRHKISVSYQAADLTSIDATKLARDIISDLVTVDALFYIAGLGDDADCGPVPEELAERLMMINFTVAVKIINAFLDHLTAQPAANIVAIGSVAEIRGRKKNVIYGAAKRGLEFYFTSLRHYLAPTDCHVQFYRLGFMKTSMLNPASSMLPAIEPGTAADTIYRNLGRNIVGRYIPRWWLLVAIILKLLPWPVFRRLDI